MAPVATPSSDGMLAQTAFVIFSLPCVFILKAINDLNKTYAVILWNFEKFLIYRKWCILNFNTFLIAVRTSQSMEVHVNGSSRFTTEANDSTNKKGLTVYIELFVQLVLALC